MDKEEINKYFNSESLAIIDWPLEEPNIITEEMEAHEICKNIGFYYFDFENITNTDDDDLYQFKKIEIFEDNVSPFIEIDKKC